MFSNSTFSGIIALLNMHDEHVAKDCPHHAFSLSIHIYQMKLCILGPYINTIGDVGSVYTCLYITIHIVIVILKNFIAQHRSPSYPAGLDHGHRLVSLKT